jgi:competence protein ComGC
MLYTVGASLPKTDFLTKIDIVIVLTIVSLALTGLAVLVIAKVHEDAGAKTAERWNRIVEVTLIVSFVLANLIIFVPAWVRQRKAMADLSQSKRKVSDRVAQTNPLDDGIEDPSVTATGPVGLWASGIVEEGHDYCVLRDLVSRQL